MATVGEMMSADLVHVERDDPVTTAATIMAAAQVGSALIMQGEDLVGIFTERDILLALRTEPHQVLDSPVERWMTPNPITVDSAASVEDAARVMLRGGFRHLPVVSGGSVVGIVSLRDLARALVER